MPDEDKLDKVMKMLHEMERKYSHTHFTIFSYIHAILAVLDDKEITNQQEFKQYLEKYKQDLVKKLQEAEFFKTMDAQFKDEKKDKGSKKEGNKEGSKE